MWLSLVAALVLREPHGQVPPLGTVPPLDTYLGFPEDVENGDLSDLAGQLAAFNATANALRVNSSAGVNSTSARIKCPAGVQADVRGLSWRMQHASRKFAVSKPVPRAGRTYIFVIVPPGYGSTAVLSMLASSPNVGTLCASSALNCEGCYILYFKNLLSHEDRWQRDQPPDWVKAVDAFEEFYQPPKQLRVEKSPNNIVKTQAIAKQLSAAGHHVRFVVMSRSPCFVGAAGHHGAGIYTWAWDFFAQEMLATLGRTASGPGSVAALHVRYEDLLADPYQVSASLLNFMPELGSIDPTVNGLEKKGGTMLPGKDDGRSKSVVQYLLEYKNIPADHYSVDGKYRGLMQQLGYQTPAIR